MELDELYDSLKEMEYEYQWTQDPELKLRMMATARQINDLLITEKKCTHSQITLPQKSIQQERTQPNI